MVLRKINKGKRYKDIHVYMCKNITVPSQLAKPHFFKKY